MYVCVTSNKVNVALTNRPLLSIKSLTAPCSYRTSSVIKRESVSYSVAVSIGFLCQLTEISLSHPECLVKRKVAFPESGYNVMSWIVK